ncbi:MAG: amidohydrolase, partial [Calditrichia bacterium]
MCQFKQPVFQYLIQTQMHPTSLHPDYIFYNGRIFNPVSQYLNLQTALAIHAEKIFAVGNDSHILSLASPETRKFDCRGNWILPAFTDAHTHLCLYAARKLQVDLSGCASLNEALAVISEKVAVTPEGSWIRGGGWDKNSWGMENFPDKKYLDEISSRHFIALDSKDWHTLWVNSAVLQLCHISAATVHPGGGKIVKNDRNGEPTGILLENARWIVYDKIPPVAVKQLSNVLIHSFPEFHRLGITAVHSMETPDDYCVYQKLRDEGKLGLRISGYLPEKFLKEAKNLKSNPAYMNPFLKICGIKIFADGTLGSQTADMLDNFTGTNQRGIAVHSEEELHHIVEESVKTGLSCAVHAIGDAANRKVLDVFQEFDEQSRAAGLRHRIEHVQLLHPQDIPRFQQLGVFASMQPIHLAADIPVIKKYWGERGKYAFAFRSL